MLLSVFQELQPCRLDFLVGGWGVALSLNSENCVKFRRTPYLPIFGVQYGFLFRLGIVVVVIALIHKHKRYEVRAVKIPVPQPRPKAEVAVDSLNLFVVRAARESRGYLLSSAFFGEASSSNILSADALRSCICLTALPT